jgi:hypothetical protein
MSRRAYAKSVTLQMPDKPLAERKLSPAEFLKQYNAAMSEIKAAQVWEHYNPGQEQGNADVTEKYHEVTEAAIKAVWEKEQTSKKQGNLFK